MLWIFIRILRNSWDDFYKGSANPAQTLENGNYNNENKPKSFQASVYVYNSLFSDCSSSKGGAIDYNQAGKILIEFTTFTKCSASSSGGAVYSENCECVINSVCSYICSASNDGQSIRTKLSDDKINYVYQSSVCSNCIDESGNDSPICLSNGKQQSKMVNITGYKVSMYSAIYCDDGSSAPLITYCSLNFNTAIVTCCLYLNSNGQSIEIDSSNILNNKQDTNSYATISCDTTTYIKNSCILGNDGPTNYSMHCPVV